MPIIISIAFIYSNTKELVEFMITLTDRARTELDAYFSDKERSPIRIYLAPGGCSGPRLALALDEPGEEDKVFEPGGYTFCVNGALLEQSGAINIDLGSMGFAVTSEVQLGGGGGGCSGCGSSSSCCG